MSLAKIVAQLVERGEEDLAEELLSLGAERGLGSFKANIDAVMDGAKNILRKHVKTGDKKMLLNKVATIAYVLGMSAVELDSKYGRELTRLADKMMEEAGPMKSWPSQQK